MCVPIKYLTLLDAYFIIPLRLYSAKSSRRTISVSTITRWDAFHKGSSLQEQVNRLFEATFSDRAEQSALTTWAPAVDIYETENDLVLKADLPDMNEKDLDIRVENNMLTIRGERKFEQKVKRRNYLRDRAHLRLVQPQLQLADTVNNEAIQADYKNGVLTVELPKRAEAKPKQVKVNVTNGNN